MIFDGHKSRGKESDWVIDAEREEKKIRTIYRSRVIIACKFLLVAQQHRVQFSISFNKKQSM